MAIAHSRLTAQGQVSVPAEVRRKLGVGPGSVIEWRQHGDQLVVRRSSRHGLADLHRALFPKGPPRKKTLTALSQGIAAHVRKKHARR
jgi:antitoxin PrlF